MLRIALAAAMAAIPLVALLIVYAPNLLMLIAACLVTATIAVSVAIAVARPHGDPPRGQRRVTPNERRPRARPRHMT